MKEQRDLLVYQIRLKRQKPNDEGFRPKGNAGCRETLRYRVKNQLTILFSFRLVHTNATITKQKTRPTVCTRRARRGNKMKPSMRSRERERTREACRRTPHSKDLITVSEFAPCRLRLKEQGSPAGVQKQCEMSG